MKAITMFGYKRNTQYIQHLTTKRGGQGGVIIIKQHYEMIYNIIYVYVQDK